MKSPEIESFIGWKGDRKRSRNVAVHEIAERLLANPDQEQTRSIFEKFRNRASPERSDQAP